MSKRVKLGNIYAIPLPNDKYAFGRVMKDAGLAIYNGEYDSIEDFDKDAGYRYVISVYRDLLMDGEWPVIGNIPFANEEEAWPPPRCIFDNSSGELSIYHKGEIRKATTEDEEDDCVKMEMAAVSDRHHLIDRLMGDTKWEDLNWTVNGKDMRIKVNRLELKKERKSEKEKGNITRS